MWNPSEVREGTRSLAHYLGEHGYRVGISGKRHYAPEESFPFESLNSTGTANDKEVPEMDLIRDFVNRDPAQPFLLLVTGYPAPEAMVPDIRRKDPTEFIRVRDGSPDESA